MAMLTVFTQAGLALAVAVFGWLAYGPQVKAAGPKVREWWLRMRVEAWLVEMDDSAYGRTQGNDSWYLMQVLCDEVYWCGIVYWRGIAPFICRVAGHKLVDRSYAGPDTGGIFVECTRCGFEAGSVLY